MSNFSLIVVAMGLGFWLKKLRKPLQLPENVAQGVNVFVLYVSLPSMALYYIPKVEFSAKSWLPLSLGLLILVFALVFFGIFKYIFGYSKNTYGALVLACGFGNISFVGYPLVEAFYGKEALKTAVLIDQGTFLVLAVLGILLALYFSGKQLHYQIIVKKLLYFPAFEAFVIALLLNFLALDFPEFAQSTFKRFAETLSPLALFSVGWQLSFDTQAVNRKDWLLGLSYKLFLIPFVFFMLLGFPKSLSDKIIILESAMAPMITSSLIASENGLNPKLANFLVAIGIPLSLLSVSFWYWLMEI